MLRNYTEVVVAEVFDSVLREEIKQNPDLCDCQRCREDVMAVALNRLPPRYVARGLGEVYTKASFDQVGGKAQIIAALMHGFKLVGQSPRHKKDPTS
ncbi:MAG: late competence development ComFB family protein [Eubacteriales bacterium]|nr:late competence development ComFB family protein [Bacillota bacterium]MBV1726846.1 late competence development ComFB family protein [Desulforudis sp.]MDQ7789045.1 late competence development ComFB family protein [Clostridia bacterium]MDZ4043059.1 late competence development ComFB family protein [Eubacteriales bacterium]MBV1736019.1 late competence development ComFB family protein [Desulforudis sp.]